MERKPKKRKKYDKTEMKQFQYLLVISTQLLLVSIEELIIGDFADYMVIAIAAEMVLYLLYFGWPRKK